MSLSLPALHFSADDPPTTHFRTLRRLMSKTELSDTRFASYLRLLIRERGFPAPLPTMVKRVLIDDVCAQSCWLTAALDGWFASQLAPAEAATLTARAQAAAAAEMDAAATGLSLVGGTEA